MIRRFFLALLPAAAAWVGMAQAQEPLYLVRSGKATAVLVHPRWDKPEPPAKETTADGEPTAEYAARQAEYRRLHNLYFANVVKPAGTLQQYVRLISGVTLPIAEDGSQEHQAASGAEVHIGRTAFVDSLGLELGAHDKQYVVLKRAGDKLVIACGGDPRLNTRGLGFALSTFLMDVLDVHHYLPEAHRQIGSDPLWTILPSTNTVAVEALDYARTPDYLSRSFSLGTWANERTPWSERNRISWGSRYHIPHNIGRVLDPAEYGEEHPEFYPLLNGERKVPGKWMLTKNWQPCYSNPDLPEVVAREARAYFDAHPEAELLSLAHNDNWGWCECEACLEANGGRHYDTRGGLSFSNVEFGFLNQVCEKLAETHPGKLIGAMVYQNGTYAPPGFKLHPNIVALLTRDFSVFHGSAREAENARTFIGAWSQVAKHLAVHAWHVDFQGADYPRLELASTRDFLRYFHGAGGISYHGEEYTSFGFDGPKTWITAQLLWDVSKDPHALLQQFCDDCFGPAAEPMRRYFETAEQAWNENTTNLVSVWYLHVPIEQVITPVVLAECRRHLDDALAMAATEKQRQRVEHFRKAFLYTKYAAQFAFATRDCALMARERELTPGMFAELVARLNEAAFSREALAQYLEERMRGDPTMLCDGGKKASVKPIEPLYCKVASTLTVRLARELDGAESQDSFTAALRDRYGALRESMLARLEEEPLRQGLAWEAFSRRVDNFLGASTVVPRRTDAPVLDGRLSAGEWDAAPVLTGFFAFSRQGSLDDPAEHQTEVRLGYDDRALYVAYRLIEKDVNHLLAMVDQRDGTVWRDDSADFTILPPSAVVDRGRQYILNSKGAVFDRIGDDTSWDSAFTMRSGVDEETSAWVLELAIPWSDFGREPVPGEVWRAQFGRSDWQSGTCKASSWAPVQGNLGDTDYLGILLFE